MINKCHIIFYVKDQEKSTEFYSTLLEKIPVLNVPGMTEFEINDGVIFGLMPSTGIEKLLGDRIISPSKNTAPKAELYLIVDDADSYLKKALSIGARQLSEMELRDWGHKAAYFIDLDDYIVALAEIS